MKRFASILFIAAAAISTSAQFAQPNEVPAYNAAPPSKGQKLPAIMSGPKLAQFPQPVQAKSYQVAARNAAVLHQLPCYCYCDRNHGHNSLHSCFESEHGGNCGVCMAEAFYADEQVKKGKTAKQIRAEIIKGGYKSVDLAKYNAVANPR
jgi:hypothetical protein